MDPCNADREEHPHLMEIEMNCQATIMITAEDGSTMTMTCEVQSLEQHRTEMNGPITMILKGVTKPDNICTESGAPKDP